MLKTLFSATFRIVSIPLIFVYLLVASRLYAQAPVITGALKETVATPPMKSTDAPKSVLLTEYEEVRTSANVVERTPSFAAFPDESFAVSVATAA